MRFSLFLRIGGAPWRRWGAAAALGAFGQIALLVAVPALEACSADDTTSGKRVVLHTRIELASPSAASFENGLGWRVTLERALIATGKLGYFDGVPPLARLEPAPSGDGRTARNAYAALLGLSVAWAHPGHYQAGNALGEMLEPWSVNLLDGTSELADGDGVTGTYRSARFAFGSPVRGPFSDDLGAHAALLEGEARLDGEETRYFLAIANVEELAKIQAGGNIDGCVFEEAAVQGDGTVTVRVEPSVWFDLVDFSELEPGTPEEPAEFAPGTQPRLAFAQGLAELSAYRFSYSK